MDSATRLQIGVGALGFGLWGILAWSDLMTGAGRLADLSRIPVHLGLLGVLALGSLVTGLAWHLAGTLWSRSPPRPVWRIGTGLALAMGGAALTLDGRGAEVPAVSTIARWSWALGATAYAIGTFAQRFITAPRPGAKRYAWSQAADATHLVTAAYALAVGLTVARYGPLAPGAVHLWTVGVLSGTVAAVLLHLLPRFRTDTPPATVAWLVFVAVLVAPAALWWAFSGGDRALFLGIGGAAFGAIVLLLVALVTWTYRNRRNPQPFVPVVTVALLVGGAGGLIGFLLGTGRLPFDRLGVHVVLQLLGFLGTMVIGMGSVMFGMPRIPWKGGHANPFGVFVVIWVLSILVWAAWHLAATPPAALDALPATLVLLLATGLFARLRRMGPIRPPRPPRGASARSKRT